MDGEKLTKEQKSALFGGVACKLADSMLHSKLYAGLNEISKLTYRGFTQTNLDSCVAWTFRWRTEEVQVPDRSVSQTFRIKL